METTAPRKPGAVGRRALLLALPALALLWPTAGRGQVAIPAADYRLIPLRIHLLRAPESPALNSKLQEADAQRILGKVNGIWKQAGIQFYAESIQVETAHGQALYEGLGPNRTESHLRLVRPRESLSDRSFHLYYIGEMRPNGICLSGSHQLLFVKETARLREVPGGIDEPLPRVSAHEIGHALGLDHRQDTTNLMASGTTGTSLNEAEVKTARATAEGLSWRLTPEAALEMAEKLPAEKRAERKALFTALAGLPDGPVSAAARKQLETLGTR